MRALEPVDTTLLLAPLHRELVRLLRDLDAEAWQRPTACTGWRVRDLAAHLLDTDLRRLSFHRDGASLPEPSKPIEGYGDLVDHLNELNAQWVTAFRRVSQAVLVEMIDRFGAQTAGFLATLPPDERAVFPVAWAGDETSPNWFDVAREYTEKWHHQQQIRDAVGANDLCDRKWLHPVLDTFVRGLPHAYREMDATEGTCVVVEILGEAGDTWTLRREAEGWRVYLGEPEEAPAARTRIDQDAAWRLFTKGLPRQAVLPRLEIRGDRRLGEGTLRLLAVMA